MSTEKKPSKAIDWQSFGLHEQEDGTVNLEMPLGENSPAINCNWMCTIKKDKIHVLQGTASSSDHLNQSEFGWSANLQSPPRKRGRALAFFAKLNHFLTNFDSLTLLFARFSLFLFIGACFGLSLYSFITDIHSHRFQVRHNLFDRCNNEAILIQQMFNQSLLKVESARSLIKTFYTNESTPLITQDIFFKFFNQSIINWNHDLAINYVERVPREEIGKFKKRSPPTMYKNGMYYMDNTSSYYAPIVFSYSLDDMNVFDPMNNTVSDQASHFQALVSRINGSDKFFLSTSIDKPLPQIVALLPVLSDESSVLGWIFSEFHIHEIISFIQMGVHNRDKHSTFIRLYDVTDARKPIEIYSSADKATKTSELETVSKMEGTLTVKVVLGGDNLNYVLSCSSYGNRFPWRTLTWVVALVFMLCGFYGSFYLITVKKKIHELSESFETMRYLRDHAQKAKQAAENADASKSQFLATISHEIRTPLNGVIGMLSLLRETKLDANQLDYVQTAVSSGKALISLINDVLDFSKIEAGKMEIEHTAFDLRAEVEDVVVLFAEATRTKGIELGVLVQHSIPAVLVGDSARFRQVLINLIGNATKFTDEGHILVSIFQLDEEEDLETIHQSFGGFQSDLNTTSSSPYAWQRSENVVTLNVNSNGFAITETPTRRHSTSSSSLGRSLIDEDFNPEEEKAFKLDQRYETLSGCLTASSLNTYEKVAKWMIKPLIYNNERTIRLGISVEDTGQGVPLNAQERIFQPFKQADSGTFRRAGGTGIGLNISKRLVELMGGKLNFVSTPSIGSTFFFDIQLKLNEDPDQASQARLIKPDSVKGQSILMQSGLDHTCSVDSHRKQKLMGSHVLLIDSLPLRAKVLSYHLRSMGITCDFAQSSTHAMEMLQSQTPQVKPAKLAHAVSLGQAAFQTNLSGFDFQSHLEGLDLKRPGSGNLCRMSSVSMDFEEGSFSSAPCNKNHLRDAKKGKYSAVFVDADSSIWEKRGLEFGKQVRKSMDTDDLPLILISQKVDSAFHRSAVRCGFSSVLLKPLRRASISFALSKALKIDLDQGTLESTNQNVDMLTNLLKGKRIMCVDDNLVNRRVASKMLSKFGVETLCMESGTEAVEYIQQHIEIDLILMDIQMPGMDGYEASTKIREFENQLNAVDLEKNIYNPIVAMTADVLKGTKEKCLAAGMDGYLTKPIDPAELSRTVAKFFSPKLTPSPNSDSNRGS